MDPLSLCASIAGLTSLTIELIRILRDYTGGFKSAPNDAQELLTEIILLHDVLNQLKEFLRSEDMKGKKFDQSNVLSSIIVISQNHIQDLVRKLEKPLQDLNSLGLSNASNGLLMKKTANIMLTCCTAVLRLSISHSQYLTGKSWPAYFPRWRKKTLTELQLQVLVSHIHWLG